MRLTRYPSFTERPPLNYGDSPSHAPRAFSRAAVSAALACLASLCATDQAAAQQVNQPGFDPRQTEKRFDEIDAGQAQPAAPLRMPALARPAVTADNKPIFVLRAVRLAGATALPPDRLTAAYRPYLGEWVSQADLATIAERIGDVYRAAGYHLSRAIIPPQDIQEGRVRIEVIEGSIAEIVVKGDEAQQFGLRPLLNPVLAEHPARLATLERQLFLVSGLPGVRITDSKKSAARRDDSA